MLLCQDINAKKNSVMLRQFVLSQRTWSITMQYNPTQCRNEASLCKSRLQVLD